METERQWHVETDEWINTSPTVVDGTVYAGSNDGILYAIDADAGEERWRFETGETIPGAPSVVDGTVVTSSEDGHLYALDTTDGSERWRYQFDTPMYDMPSPAVFEGTVYGGTSEHGTNHVYAIDIERGTERWIHETDESVDTAPVVFETDTERLVVFVVSPTMGNPSLVGYDPTDGTERWRYTSEQPLETAPTVDPRTVDTDESDPTERLTVFLPDRYQSVLARAYDTMIENDEQPTPPSVQAELTGDTGGSVFGFDAITGKRRLQISAPGPPTTVPTVADGTVYVGTGTGQLFAANTTTGEIEWKQPLGVENPTRAIAAPTVVGDRVLVGTNEGTLLSIDTETGDLEWFEAIGVPVGAPTVVDGIAYLSTHDGLKALDLPDCTESSRGSRVCRATLGHHGDTIHQREKPALDGACPNCKTALSAVEDPSYCWVCGWDLH